MTWADSISASDRDLMKRLTIALVLLVLFIAAFSQLERLYSQKFFDATGRARWIWAQHPLNRDIPIAFFATRDFDLPERRLFTQIKILGDPEYTLYVNGREVSGRRLGAEGEMDRTLARYDISDLVTTGRNRIVVALRSPQGLGGLIAAVDLGPETQNWLVTDEKWRIYRVWRPELLVRDPQDTAWEPPLIIGEPPVGRWNYLAVEPAMLMQPPTSVVKPSSVSATAGLIPRIRTSGGVAVAVNERQEATLFDFGFTKGRIRLRLNEPRDQSSSIRIRLANEREEVSLPAWAIRPMVVAPGESVVTTPEVHSFRYVLVFDRAVHVEIARRSPDADQ